MNKRKILFITAGCICLLLALAGALLPLVPGCLFFVLAIICFVLAFLGKG